MFNDFFEVTDNSNKKQLGSWNSRITAINLPYKKTKYYVINKSVSDTNQLNICKLNTT